MRRRILNLLTALSLLLFLGVTVLAVRSHWHYDVVRVRWNPAPPEPTSSGQVVICTSRPGQIWLTLIGVTDADAGFWRGMFRGGVRTHTVGGDGPAVEVESFRWNRQPPGGRPPFRWERSEQAPSFSGGRAARAMYRTVVVPHWSVMLLTAALPLARLPDALAALRRTGRAARSQCVRCGYDLRATPGRCPECGHVTSAPQDIVEPVRPAR
jgi:hypothetical protein